MSTLNEKMAYLEGFIEGLDISDDTKEGKAILAIVDLLEDIVEECEDMSDDLADLEQLGDELDEDLGQMEEFLFDGCCCEDDDDECCCCDEDDDDFDFGPIICECDDDEEECGCGCKCEE